ncbi:MAG: alpha/beta fold hydrolase BchO [Alphaproteobacteria bacterium]
MSQRLNWEHDRHIWPHAQASEFIAAAGLRWHVQKMGHGPVFLLLHGTGASTHSWRGLIPSLAEHFLVVAIDLPGHAFTSRPPPRQLSLPGMAAAIADLMQVLGLHPDFIAGHSAGTAVAVQMTTLDRIDPQAIASINGALMPWRGIAGQLFSPLAKVLASTSIAARVFAKRASQPDVIHRMLRETGSRLDAQGAEYYRRLAADPDHVAATLGMMANWDLRPLQAVLHTLKPHALFITGSNDKTIPPGDSHRVRRMVPDAKEETLLRLGHLAHEEAPDAVSDLLIGFAKDVGIIETHIANASTS